MEKTKITLTLSLLLILWALAGQVAPQVYRHIDKDGVVHFTDTPTDKKFAPHHGSWTETNVDREATEEEENKEEIGREGENQKQKPLVPRQGDFAVQLVEALNIGQAQDEAQAESILSAMGIEPKNGWIAGYPVTPAIFIEIKNKVVRAADAGKLRMGSDHALKAVGGLKARFEQRLTNHAPGSGISSSVPSPVKAIVGKPLPPPHPNDSIKSSSPHKVYQSPTSSESSVGRARPETPAGSSPDSSVMFPSTRRLYQPQGSYPSMEPSELKAVNPGDLRVPSHSDGSVRFPQTREFYGR